MIFDSSSKSIEKLNGVVGLILIVLSCIVTFGTKSMLCHAFFALWLFLLLLFFGAIERAIVAISVYSFSFIWLRYIAPLGIRIPSPLLFSMIFKFSLLFMAGIFTSAIPSGKVLQVLRKLPFPNSVMLVVVVLLRFAPTVSGEFREVREAMKVRGMIGRFRGFKRPLKTLEYAVVPLIFRSIKVADELAAASMVRGIESPYKKSGYYENKFFVTDAVVILISIILTIICIMN